MSPKSTSYDIFYEIHQVVLDGISDNIDSLVESGKCEPINKTDTSTNGFYVIMFTSGEYTLQENTTIDVQVITSGELAVKEKYLCSMQTNSNCYWNQQTKHHVTTVPTCTIIHPQLEVNAVTDFNSIPTSVCTRTQGKKSKSRKPICLTCFDFDCILEEIGCRDNIEFERDLEVYSENMED